MTNGFFNQLIENLNIFDLAITVIFIYFIIQCFLKGFSLSLISFMKWVFSTIITIILVPKLQPVVSDYIESQFINSIGLGLVVFFITLFITIVIGKSLSRVITWTGVGAIDRTFGLLFGFFKGYVVSVCIFSVLNWFYPYKNWGISAEDAIFFDLINNGSEILIKEFPSSEDFIDTKEQIEKI
jgi:membrane protein required for colicin V production